MDSPRKWLALGYSLPINPSRNRVYVWRKLKELGAEYFKQGVAILPGNKKNSARLARLAHSRWKAGQGRAVFFVGREVSAPRL